MDNKIKVGITHGDINGIGYELVLKTFSDEGMLDMCTPIIYGSPKVAAYHKKAIDNQTNLTVVHSASEAGEGRVYMVNCFGDSEVIVNFSQPTSEAGKAALMSLDKALSELSKGLIDVLVTTPLNSSTIKSQGVNFPGQTEYIQGIAGDGHQSLMMLVKDNVRVAFVTTHIPISKISSSLTKNLIKEKIAVLNEALQRDFYIERPRIAVLSLNPQGGGGPGSEEYEIIEPAIEEMNEKKLFTFGPYPVDEFFGSDLFTHFDAVLAMYRDQGFVPFRTLFPEGGVNYTAGLPIVRTAPAQAVEYDIAGKGVASTESFRESIYMAIDIVRNRKRFDEVTAHPLKKQYYEKRDDSDKLKLDQVDDDTTL
ncbi:MAG: 4-hydroxythreonine-4-phosphate dehydrogenase PdxA [Bacteroidaceae bacterium]|nr:4-hydroxythreonine-4-phosphate dehydrogenase PdxA [Bacteroidaceae bacterium]